MGNKTWLYTTLGSVLIGSFFPILASQTLKSAPPFLTLTVTFSVAAIILGGIILIQRKTSELKNKKAWKYGLYTGIFNGVLFYGFYYFGLLTTAPGNAALVAQTEVVFAFLYFQAWHRESLSKSHIFGALMLVLGAIYILIPKASGWNHGDIFVLVGMMFAPIGNFYQKKGRTEVSSYTFLFIRYICTIPLVYIISKARNESGTDVVSGIYLQMALMGLFVFVVKNILWIESIKMVTVTRILALHGFMPFLTLLIIWGIYATAPTTPQLISGLPMLLGVLLLCRK